MVEPVACIRLCMTPAPPRDRGRLPKNWAVVFRTLFDLVADGVVCFAVEPGAGPSPVRLRCLLVNAAAANLLDWKPSQVVGRFASEMPAPFPLAAATLYELATRHPTPPPPSPPPDHGEAAPAAELALGAQLQLGPRTMATGPLDRSPPGGRVEGDRGGNPPPRRHDCGNPRDTDRGGHRRPSPGPHRFGAAAAAAGPSSPSPAGLELPLGDRWLHICAALNGMLLVVTLRDMTDNHRAQEQLAATNERLDATNQLLATANKELRAIADLDGLTQVANRRRFDRYLEECWQRLSRTGGPLSLVMCDIDFFKRYNDSCGHPAGDDCLRQVAEALTFAARRPADVVARYGGEEFAIILPDTDAAGAADVARHGRELLAQLAIVHPDSDVADRITLSMGIATMVPSAPWACGKLIVEADRALYRAKQAGRDRAVAVVVDS